MTRHAYVRVRSIEKHGLVVGARHPRVGGDLRCVSIPGNDLADRNRSRHQLIARHLHSVHWRSIIEIVVIEILIEIHVENVIRRGLIERRAARQRRDARSGAQRVYLFKKFVAHAVGASRARHVLFGANVALESVRTDRFVDIQNNCCTGHFIKRGQDVYAGGTLFSIVPSTVHALPEHAGMPTNDDVGGDRGRIRHVPPDAMTAHQYGTRFQF